MAKHTYHGFVPEDDPRYKEDFTIMSVKQKPKTIAYIRVSTVQQDTEAQRQAIKDFAKRQGIKINRYIELEMSSLKSTKDRKIDELLKELNPSDTLIMSELSRLARSVGQIAIITKELIDKRVRVIFIKEGIDLKPNGSLDISTKMQVTMFSLFAEIERDLISMRTKEGLKAARAKGSILGRPKGKPGKSKYDAHLPYIEQALKMGVPVSKMALKLNCSRSGLMNFIKTRNLRKEKSNA